MFKIEAQTEDKVLTMSLIGRLDTTTAPELEASVKENATDVDKLIFDLAQLEYVSSAGLRVFLASHKLMNSQGGSMIVKNVTEEVNEIFELTGFSVILTLE